MSTKYSNLRLIQGGLHYEFPIGPLCAVAAPESSQPFHVDAIVFEEDRWLIMSADPKIVDPDIHPIRLINEVLKVKPKSLGSVVIKNTTPTQFLAVIHDVDQDPTWKEEWILLALNNIFIEAEKRHMQTLGLPLLGCRHGSLSEKRFLSLLRLKIEATTFQFVRKLWIMTKKENHCDVLDCILSLDLESHRRL